MCLRGGADLWIPRKVTACHVSPRDDTLSTDERVVQNHLEKTMGQCVGHISQILRDSGEKIFDISRSVRSIFKIYTSHNGRQRGYFMVENSSVLTGSEF